MRTIIAGSRSIDNYRVVCDIINSAPWIPSLVLCGMAPGADLLGLRWAKEHKVPFEEYHPAWKEYDHNAPKVRNQQMVDSAEALILIWDQRSPGSRDVLNRAKKKGLQIWPPSL